MTWIPHDPRETRFVVDHHFFGCAARREAQRDGAKPVRAIVWGTLLVEGLSVRSINEALQHDGAVADALQRPRGHSQIVANEVELGDLRLL